MDMKLFYGLSYNPFQKDVTDTTVETIDFKEMQGRLAYLCQTKGIGVFTGRPGVSITPSPPDPFEHERSKLNSLSLPLRLSPRSISIIQLSMSPCLHP